MVQLSVVKTTDRTEKTLERSVACIGQEPCYTWALKQQCPCQQCDMHKRSSHAHSRTCWSEPSACGFALLATVRALAADVASLLAASVVFFRSVHIVRKSCTLAARWLLHSSRHTRASVKSLLPSGGAAARGSTTKDLYFAAKQEDLCLPVEIKSATDMSSAALPMMDPGLESLGEASYA